MPLVITRRTLVCVLIFGALALLFTLILGSLSNSADVFSFYGPIDPKENREHIVLDLVRGSDEQPEARKHQFLQIHWAGTNDRTASWTS